ncbi:hypothetical protein BDN72DRAFT_895703 [Pluteus cervinus]|uniref:Uncharacterized protein n=1 Tax=Pluteus cervinus TaxID=181527 RepID=A0ACD3B0M1_9AGAR|nr:hypothetical protein BDN72DRAFT_895703 [Pluteus cervinus]
MPVSGPSGRGPELIYRTSRDKFVLPLGAEAYRRLMSLRAVPENHKVAEDGCGIAFVLRLSNSSIREAFSSRPSILSVSPGLRRTTTRRMKSTRIRTKRMKRTRGTRKTNYNDIAPVVDGTVYTTSAPIWVGVITSEQAYNSSRDILDLLQQYSTADVDVAYRESEVKLLSGPELFAPVSDFDPLKDVIDSLSTPLILPIAGLRTTMQGTLGFYFRTGEDLYAVTARHVLFEADEANVEYYYDGPHRGGEDELEQSGGPRHRARCLGPSHERRYTPPVHAGRLRHHTDTDKFRHSRGNVLSLGPAANFKKLMYNRFDGPHKFVYPFEGLFKLRGILTQEEICKRNNKTPEHPIRRVIKRGEGRCTIVGGLSGFLSHVRQHFVTGSIDSVDVAIHPHDDSSPLQGW